MVHEFGTRQVGRCGPRCRAPTLGLFQTFYVLIFTQRSYNSADTSLFVKPKNPPGRNLVGVLGMILRTNRGIKYHYIT